MSTRGNVVPFKSQDDLDTEQLYRDWFGFLMIELTTPVYGSDANGCWIDERPAA